MQLKYSKLKRHRDTARSNGAKMSKLYLEWAERASKDCGVYIDPQFIYKLCNLPDGEVQGTGKTQERFLLKVRAVFKAVKP